MDILRQCFLGRSIQQAKRTSTFQSKIENKYQNCCPMSHHALRSRIVYLTKSDRDDNIYLVLANNAQSKQGKFIHLISKTQLNALFYTNSKTAVVQSSILARVQIKCQEDQNRITISIHDYNLIAHQMELLQNQSVEQKDEDGSNQMDVESQGDQNSDGQHSNPNPDHPHTIQRYNQQSSNNNLEHRGRGRPKGSKNKKTIVKEAQQLKEAPPIQLKLSVSGMSKRGKGRPKGSKNKAKDYNHSSVKIEQGSQPVPFGKRGKGRPKGSKNKIKLANQAITDKQSENQLTKKKGRPLGAKNRVNSVQSLSGQHQMSEQFVKIQIIRPQLQFLQGTHCCLRCEQSTLKRRIFQRQTNVEQNIQALKNVFQDLSLQNKSNLIITAIRLGDWQSLEQLLSIINNVVYYHSSPWNVDKMIQRHRFQTKTKKQSLSKTGKQGNTVLLHDSFKRKQLWWKQISVQRIIQNLPREQPQAVNILQKLFDCDCQLKNQIYANIASVIRSGNYAVSQHLLRQVVYTPNRNPLNVSQQHYELLVGNLPLMNQLKKYNLIQHNSGPNFCSPIHAAAISHNSEFLRKLLQIFTDIINVEDSLNRRPIHYAALSSTSQNLSILVENGADLRDQDRRKMTALMLACYQGMFYNVQYILQKVRDPNYINFKSEEGYTALHYAILSNNQECIQLLINDPYVDLWALTRDKGDLFHLLAGTGNTAIMDLILKKEILPYTSTDKFKKTPPMIAIRNNNNDCLVSLIENGCRLDKTDSSLNSLLHYAAAYGNLQAILILRDRQPQTKNKRGLFPWQVAIFKGHLGAARLLQTDQQLDFTEDPLYFALSNIRGTAEYMQVVRYVRDKMMADIYYQQRNTGNGYLHLICLLSEEEYLKMRREETYLSAQAIKQEFNWVQQELINVFVGEEGLDGYQQNFNNETPLKLCIQNNNLIGIQKLLTGKISFELQPSSGNTILHCLANLACKGLEELRFVEKKLKECNVNELKANLKKIDHNGFDFLLYFVKCFADYAASNFRKTVKKHAALLQAKVKSKNMNIEVQAQKKALDQFLKFQQKFLTVVQYLLELGCDINAQVCDRKNEISEQYKKWGLQHFIMKFPSLKLVRYLRSKIRDFNASNTQLMTPLHLFCKHTKRGPLLDTRLALPNDYSAQHVLQYLLANGLNPNCFDSVKALPLLYAALNSQHEFIAILRKYKSEVNFCTVKNETPLIEIVKRSRDFSLQQMQQLLGLGMDPNFADMDKRTPLHHLVFHSANLDGSPQLAKLLLDNGCRINALDKYDRSAIFYCFSEMEGAEGAGQPLEKVEILQVLMNHKDVNLNLLDVYKRTILHYACEQNHFFSILYLLDKNINIEAKDYQENTPLAVSLKTRNLDQAALLISKGVRYGLVNDSQKLSYFAYAFNNLSAGICFMLLDHGYPIQKALEEIPDSCFKETLIQKYIMR